jgi:hypothetical protein
MTKTGSTDYGPTLHRLTLVPVGLKSKTLRSNSPNGSRRVVLEQS